MRGNLGMPKIPVLMYHSVQGRDSAGSGCDYEIGEEEFENQIFFLKEHGFSTVLFRDIMSAKRLPEKGIILTFDDGHLSNYTIAFPLLREYGLKAEFFISSDQVNIANRMTTHHLKEMYNSGMAIGSHGVTHLYLDDLSDFEAEKELKESRRSLSSIIGQPVFSFSAPGGRFRKQHLEAAQKCGYKVFCTSRPGCFTSKTLLLDVPRMPVVEGDAELFGKIVNCDALYYTQKRLVACLLSTAKRILGNRCYETVRGCFRN